MKSKPIDNQIKNTMQDQVSYCNKLLYLQRNSTKEYIGEYVDGSGDLYVITKRYNRGEYYITGDYYDWKSYHLSISSGFAYLKSWNEAEGIPTEHLAIIRAIVYPGYRSTEALVKHFDIKESQYKTVREAFTSWMN